jgi:hypothetical protein
MRKRAAAVPTKLTLVVRIEREFLIKDLRRDFEWEKEDILQNLECELEQNADTEYQKAILSTQIEKLSGFTYEQFQSYYLNNDAIQSWDDVDSLDTENIGDYITESMDELVNALEKEARAEWRKHRARMKRKK